MTTSWRDTTAVPLAELQDVGERYTPRALREYFMRAEIPESPPFDSISPLDPGIARKIIFFARLSVALAWVCFSVGFSVDPTARPIWFCLGALIGFLGELVGLRFMKSSLKKQTVLDISYLLLTGIVTRICLVLDLLALIIIAEDKKAFIFGLAPWTVFLVDQLLVFGKFFYWKDTNSDIVRLSARDYEETDASFAHIAAPPDLDSTVPLTRVLMFSNCYLLHRIVVRDHTSIPGQILAMREMSVRIFLIMFGFHWLWFAVKVYYGIAFDGPSVISWSVRVTAALIVLQGPLTVLRRRNSR
jgi:hypothetical protein